MQRKVKFQFDERSMVAAEAAIDAMSPEEIDQELRNAGYDPVEVGRQGRVLAEACLENVRLKQRVAKLEGTMNQESTDEELTLSDLDPDHQAAYYLAMARQYLQNGKPNDRTPVDRHWAITLTELEKVIAYFDYWVCRYTDDTPPNKT